MINAIIGIDPGAKGGIALVTDNNEILFLENISNDKSDIHRKISDILLGFSYVAIRSAFLESAISMHTNRAVNNNLFFINGYITGILESFGIKVVHTMPAHWKKVMSVTSNKQTSLDKAEELFPTIKQELRAERKTYRDGLAEALLIAYYGLHLNQYYPEKSQIPAKRKERNKQREIKL